MTTNTWLECVAYLTAAYPKESISEEQLSLYAALLDEFEDRTVLRAVLRHIERSPWFPRVSELRDAALAGALEIDAEGAWGQVMAEVRRVGWPGQPVFADPRITQTLQDLGWIGVGWTDFCASTNPEADRAHFVRWYRQAQVREKNVADDQTATRALSVIARRGLSLAAIGQGGDARAGH